MSTIFGTIDISEMRMTVDQVCILIIFCFGKIVLCYMQRYLLY